MTDDRSLERAARSWLEEGPTLAPDRPVEAALALIETTRQERDLRIPWRYQPMNNSLRLALGAAAAVVVALVGVTLLPSLTSPGPEVTLSPTSTAAPAPSPTVLLREGPLTAGTYITSSAFPVSVTVTVPDGWGALRVGSTVTVLETEEAFLSFWIVQDAGRDPCNLGGVEDSPVGPTAADLASALADAPGFDAPDPVQMSIGGLDALYTELVGPLAECAEPEPELWRAPDGSCRCIGGVVGRFRLWIVDVDGTRLVVDVQDGGATEISEAALAELQAIIESLQIST